MARPWSARCYGVARQREGSRPNSIGGPRGLLFHRPHACARALMARPWSARCYGVARQREGSRPNSIGGCSCLVPLRCGKTTSAASDDSSSIVLPARWSFAYRFRCRKKTSTLLITLECSATLRPLHATIWLDDGFEMLAVFMGLHQMVNVGIYARPAMERSAAGSYLLSAEGPPSLAISPMDKNAQLH